LINNAPTLTRWAGIPVRVHWTALIAGAFFAFTMATEIFPLFSADHSAMNFWVAGMIGASLVGLSVVAHEFGHAIAARRHGVDTRSISLWLLGGVAQLESDAPHARGAGEIAVAGPVVSVALGVGFAAAAAVSQLAGGSELAFAVAAWLAVVNLGMAVFNMVPAFPLDGGRLLQAVLWHRSGQRHTATITASRLGSFLGAVMVTVGLYQLLSGTGSGISLLLVGAFVRRAARTERRHAKRAIRRSRATTTHRGGPQNGEPIWPGQPRPQPKRPSPPSANDFESQLPLRHRGSSFGAAPWAAAPIPVPVRVNESARPTRRRTR